MSYAWIDVQTTGLTIELLVRRKSDMAVWDGDSWEADSTLTDLQLAACAISFSEIQSSDGTTIGYAADIPAGVTVESVLLGYSGGYTAGDAATWQGEWLVGATALSGVSLTADGIADAVWDEVLSGHTDAGSAGLVLSTLSGGGSVELTAEGETLTAEYSNGSHSVRILWKVDGVLTDVTSAKLSDATGSYGVQRDDTLDVVVADGTDMTNESTGIYTYSFDEPAQDLTYTAWAEIVYGGNTYRFEYDITGTASSGSSTVAVTYATLQYVIGMALGLNADSDNWTAAQTAQVDAIIKSGLRRFYWPKAPNGEPEHEWSFLRKTATISLADGDDDYDLPTDFVSVYGKPLVQDKKGGVIDPIEPHELLGMQARQNLTGIPQYYAVRPKANDGTTGTRYEMLVYPTPGESDTLSYQYICEPAMIDSTNLYPLGGIAHGETIQSAVLSAMENIKGDYEGVHTKAFLEQLAASIRIDKGQRA